MVKVSAESNRLVSLSNELVKQLKSWEIRIGWKSWNSQHVVKTMGASIFFYAVIDVKNHLTVGTHWQRLGNSPISLAVNKIKVQNDALKQRYGVILCGKKKHQQQPIILINHIWSYQSLSMLTKSVRLVLISNKRPVGNVLSLRDSRQNNHWATNWKRSLFL